MVVNMNEEMFQQLSVLADKSRFSILQMMAKGCIATCSDRIEAFENGCCVSDVVSLTGLSQPTVSHHLKLLEQVGLVRREARGTWKCFFPDEKAIGTLTQWLQTELSPRQSTNPESPIYLNRDSCSSAGSFELDCKGEKKL
jgi:ArsR family transcriptional regulator